MGAKGLDGDGGFQLASVCGVRAGVGSWGSWICVSGSKPVDMSRTGQFGFDIEK